MTMTWDLTDVPAVEAADLAAAMRALIDGGRGLVLLNGMTESDLDLAHAEIKRRYHAEPQLALAVFVRLRNLIEVFSARRLKDQFLDKGYALMAPALAVAASLRLNANRGFNPQKFMASLAQVETANVTPLEARRAKVPAADVLLAA
jgi:hypothetical protein